MGLGKVSTVLVAAALLVAACGGETTPGIAITQDEGADSGEAGTAASESGTSGDVGTSGSAGVGADGGGGEAEALSQPVPSSISGLVLDGLVAERSGTTLTLRFQITNDGAVQHTWAYQLADAPAAESLASPNGVVIIDSTAGEVYAPLEGPEGSACVCSPLSNLSAGGTAEYFVTFDESGLTDFEVSIPTFPLLEVRGDVAAQPTDPSVAGPLVDVVDGNGLVLEGLVLRSLGQWTVAEFEVANPADVSYTWAYGLSADVAAAEVGRPTGITIFDPVSQATATVAQPSGRPCACSALGAIPGGGKSTYFVYLETDLEGPVDVALPGFPQVTGVLIAG